MRKKIELLLQVVTILLLIVLIAVLLLDGGDTVPLVMVGTVLTCNIIALCLRMKQIRKEK